MKKKLPHITAAELRILKVLWRNGPQTVRQVKNLMTTQDGMLPAYTTVMTMMKQLAEKGALEVDRTRQTFIYAAAVRREQVLRARMAEFLGTVFDGKVEDLVVQLVEDSELSAKDFRRIEAKIAKREKELRASRSPRAKGGKR